jgi:hypothetical protein
VALLASGHYHIDSLALGRQPGNRPLVVRSQVYYLDIVPGKELRRIADHHAGPGNSEFRPMTSLLPCDTHNIQQSDTVTACTCHFYKK